jgi:hypothetical protein
MGLMRKLSVVPICRMRRIPIFMIYLDFFQKSEACLTGHCEARLRRSNPDLPRGEIPGLLRFARNDANELGVALGTHRFAHPTISRATSSSRRPG